MAAGLAAGARVGVLGRRREAAEARAEEIRRGGSEAMVLVADVLDEGQLRDVQAFLRIQEHEARRGGGATPRCCTSRPFPGCPCPRGTRSPPARWRSTRGTRTATFRATTRGAGSPEGPDL